MRSKKSEIVKKALGGDKASIALLSRMLHAPASYIKDALEGVRIITASEQSDSTERTDIK